MNQLKTVLKFEYNSYVRTKIFMIITALLVAAVVIAINIPNISNVIDSFRGDSEYEEGQHAGGYLVTEFTNYAAVYDPEGYFTQETLNRVFPFHALVPLTEFDVYDLKERIVDGEFEFALRIDGRNYEFVERGGGGVFAIPIAMQITELVRFAYQERMAAGFGLESYEFNQISRVTPSRVNHHSALADTGLTFMIGYVMLMLLFISIQFYGQGVMTSVVTEKSSKAMEVLITSVKPLQLMFGKVLGTGLAGLTQLGLFLVAAFVAFQLTMSQWEEFAPFVANIMSMSLTFEFIAFAIIFFILAFFIFAFLFAGFGSTVSRLEDVNKVIMIPYLLFMASFMIAMFGGQMAPDSTFFVVSSFVPFLSPLVMFMRYAMQIVPIYQVWIAIGINTVSVIAMGFLCAKIYRAGVLMYGKPPSFMEIIKQLAKA